MTSSEILKALDEGFTLHSSIFGFWLISPIDARCTNVHNGAAKALVRKKKIVKFGERWVKTERLRQEILDRMNAYWLRTDGTMAWPNSCEGDLLKLTYNFLKLKV